MSAENIDRRTFNKTLGLLPFWIRDELKRHETLGLKQIPEFRCLVIYYHSISPSFESDLNYLFDLGYTPITLIDLVLLLSKGALLPFKEKSMLIIFDDGLESQFSIGLPILSQVNSKREEKGLSPVIPAFYIMTQLDFLKSVYDANDDTPTFRNGEGQVAYLKKGQVIKIIQLGYPVGNHTYEHRNLTRISLDQKVFQITAGEERVRQLHQAAGKENLYDKDTRTFVYPFGLGAGDVDVISILNSINYLAAFTTHHQILHDNSFMIGRVAGYNLRASKYSELLRLPEPPDNFFRCVSPKLM
ncbi:polysaccharide deacetylase family protein [Candidatus Woesebacteria bacterium]|nr:polysaccharide deacetylase family protein [Candidatus Woesebacteria bacterium]